MKTERNENQEYVVKPDEAAIVIKQDGDVEVLLPDSDVDDNGMISSDSPTFKAMTIMMFIKNQELREQVQRQLVEEHFSGNQ